MKILLLISSLGSGGAERQLVNLALLFKKNKLNVEFLVYQDDDFFRHLLDSRNIKVHKLKPKNNFDRILQVRKYIRTSNCDVVISFLEINNFLACLSAIGGKKWKLITNELSAKESTFTSKRGKLFAWFQRYADVLVCNSNNAKSMWLENYPQYRNKLGVIYNPVILPEVSSNYIPKRDNKLNIVIAASYQYLKNPIGLIKALGLMDDQVQSQLNIDWYGRSEITSNDTRAYDESTKMIEALMLSEIIHLHQPTKDIINKMNEADCIALFSSVEGLPNVVCEGMTIGKPIIMSKVSDYSVLVDSSNGFLCDWGNPESIKDSLVSAINLSEDQLIDMGKKSKEKADQLFDSDVIINHWIKLLH